ncbi:MAG: thiamine pyrophosphate-dependent dehydrogenase E1 component subunit alpha [Bryobacteraceae bacterium]
MPQKTDWLVDRWRTMLTIRRAEETIAAMVESGEVRGPCHLYIGQEAVASGVCAALRKEDTVWGGHRSHGHYIAKGGSVERLFAEVLGKASGCSAGRGGSMHLAAPEIGILGTVPIVGGTVPLAVGAAFAAKFQARQTGNAQGNVTSALQASQAHAECGYAPGGMPDCGQDAECLIASVSHATYHDRPLTAVSVAFFGDGTIEEGHVHEAMNLAAIYKLPVLFLCENNLYSSHMHWSERRLADNLYRAGEFHSIPGERVDGNDVEAVYKAAARAIARARDGGGPSLIECRTFRWRGHVGASFDLDVGVKRRGELSEWLLKDPIRYAEERLAARGLTDLSQEKAEIERAVEDAIAAARAEASPAPRPSMAFVWRETACAG